MDNEQICAALAAGEERQKRAGCTCRSTMEPPRGWIHRKQVDVSDRADLSLPLKVDIAAFHIRADQPYAEPVADIHAFRTAL